MIPKFNKDDALIVTDDQVAWVVNLMYVGVGIGSLVPFLLMDRIGRKRTLMIATLPKMISWILIGTAKELTSLYIGRIIAGIGCGVTYSVMPMYMGEVASKRTRGPLGTLIAVILNIGMLLAYAIGLNVSRFVLSSITIWIPIIFLGCFVWLPESSVFLTRKNQLLLAEKTLKWSLAKENVDVELEEVKRIVATEDHLCNKITFKDSLKAVYEKKENKRAFGIAVILSSALTLTGAAPILAYQSVIFQEAEFDISMKTSIVMTGLTIVLAGVCCVLLVRTTGKRLLLLISAPASFVSLLTMAGFFALLSNGYDLSNYKWIPTVFLIIYVFGYGFALNPVPLAYMGEIFTVDVKVPAAIFSSLYYAITTTAVIKFHQVFAIIVC